MNSHQTFSVLLIFSGIFIGSIKSMWDPNLGQVPLYYGAYYPDENNREEEYSNPGTELFYERNAPIESRLSNYYPAIRNWNEEEQDVAREYRFLRNLAKMEHVFEPRPQVINYIFSPEKNVKKLQDANGKKEESQIMSLEISETSEKPHKIRHHHGDRSKRNSLSA